MDEDLQRGEKSKREKEIPMCAIFGNVFLCDSKLVTTPAGDSSLTGYSDPLTNITRTIPNSNIGIVFRVLSMILGSKGEERYFGSLSRGSDIATP